MRLSPLARPRVNVVPIGRNARIGVGRRSSTPPQAALGDYQTESGFHEGRHKTGHSYVRPLGRAGRVSRKIDRSGRPAAPDKILLLLPGSCSRENPNRNRSFPLPTLENVCEFPRQLWGQRPIPLQYAGEGLRLRGKQRVLPVPPKSSVLTTGRRARRRYEAF